MVLSHFLFNKLYMEQSAFEGFFKELYPSLVNYAGRVLNDRNAGEEVVQTVFTNLWLKKDSITIKTSYVSYFYKSVYNACLNSKVHSRILSKYIDSSHVDLYFDYVIQQPQAEMELHSKEFEKAVMEACNNLPPQTKKVFVMSRFDGVKNSEIAEKLGITTKTVENHINMATKRLKKDLEWLLVLICFYNL